jgi:anti-sigma regulatory factor (Ser/Thr protein kinase)
VNVISYAYAPSAEKKLWIECHKLSSSQVEIKIKDKGAPFNPLEHISEAQAQINLPAEERRIGGLGVFLLQKMVDEVKYEYQDKENRLSLIVQI